MSVQLDKRKLLFLFVLFLVVEGALVFWFSRPWLNGDSEVYLGLAKSLSHGAYGAFTPNGFEADALRSPGYPIIIAFFVHAIGLPLAGVVIFQLGLCISLLVVVDLTMVRNEHKAVFRALALAYPFPLFYSSYIMTEPWVMACLTAGACVMSRGKLSYATLISAGILSGFAALLRPDMILAPLVASLAILWRFWDERWSGLRAVGLSLVPLFVAAAVLAPYAIWNGMSFGKFSPLPLAGAVGSSMYSATWQEKVAQTDIDSIYRGNPTRGAIQSGLYAETRSINRSIGAPEHLLPTNPAWYPTRDLQIKINVAAGQRGLERISEDPGSYAKHVFHNIWRLWNTSVYPESIPSPVRMLLIAASYLVFALGLMGSLAALAGVRHFRGLRPAALIMLYPFGVHLWLHTEARYTAGVRPLLLLFAAITIASLLSQFPRRARGGRAQEPG